MDRSCSVRITSSAKHSPGDIAVFLQEADKFIGVRCIQRQRDSSVVVTYRSEAQAIVLDEMSGVPFRGEVLNMHRIGKAKSIVKVHYLPFEVEDADVREALSEYGEVCGLRHETLPTCPTVSNGVRSVTMYITQMIPSFLMIKNFQARIWYPGQVQTCRLCGDSRHLASECPDRKCFNCKQRGHVVRECPQPVVCFHCHEQGHFISRCPELMADDNESSPLDRDVGSRASADRVSGPLPSSQSVSSDVSADVVPPTPRTGRSVFPVRSTSGTAASFAEVVAASFCKEGLPDMPSYSHDSDDVVPGSPPPLDVGSSSDALTGSMGYESSSIKRGQREQDDRFQEKLKKAKQDS